MSDSQKDFIKKNGITLANFVMLIGIIITGATWKANVDIEIEESAKHRADKEMHMPFQEKIMLFMPRNEINSRFDMLQQGQDEIKERLNK